MIGIDDAAVLLGGLFNFGGNLLGGNAQAKSAEDQQRQAQRMFELENNWRTDSSEFLKTILPQFDFNMPDANKYFGTDSINKQYDIGRQNLNFGMNQAVNDTSAQAGALSASKGYANNNAFVGNMANQVRQSYIPQFGALEQQRAGALQGNQAQLFQALMQQFGQGNQLRQNQFNNQFDIQKHRIGG